MCMFSRHVRSVSSTSILVREVTRGNHALVYSMAVDAREPVAMILPVPVLKGSGDDAIIFVNLQDYPDFFRDLDKCFERERGGHRQLRGMAKSLNRDKLVVHSVGGFVASYVPSVPDFDRLDEQFRLPIAIWDQLPKYQDYGFAVFQLKAEAKLNKIHPMAYTYPADNPDQLFFPTYHIHDGDLESEAEYDHMLYYQPSETFPHFERNKAFVAGDYLPTAFMSLEKTKGLVAEEPIVRRRVNVRMLNCDHIVESNGSLSLVGP